MSQTLRNLIFGLIVGTAIVVVLILWVLSQMDPMTIMLCCGGICGGSVLLLLLLFVKFLSASGGEVKSGGRL